MTMESLRKWFYKPKRDDKSLLAQFFFADEALNSIASELDSFDGRKDPERCTSLVNMLRQSQDRVLTFINAIMDVLIPSERANRDFRVKFPEDVLQENLAGQLWFGAECLAAGSSIMNREIESAAMRPLAKALTRSLENVRNLLREACLRNNTPNGPLRLPDTEFISESLKIFDRIFADFELCYVSAMVPVKTTQEYELQELISVLFSETLQRALKMKLLQQDQVDDYDPALMFTIPRLAIVSGLLIYPNDPLCIDRPIEHMSEMFRPFKTLLHKIRELLWTLNKRELYMLEKLLCDNEQITDYRSVSEVNSDGHSDLDDFVNRFYNDYPLCKDFVSSFYTVTANNSDTETDIANEAAEIAQTDLHYLNQTAVQLLEPEPPAFESLFPDYETISDSSLDHLVGGALPEVAAKTCNGTFFANSTALSIPSAAALDSSLDSASDETVVPPLDEIISNVICATNYFAVADNETVQPVISVEAATPRTERPASDCIEIPSTSSGYLLANTVEHDTIMASISNPEQSPQRVESLPDRDCMEAISAATATLSTLLSSTKVNDDTGTTDTCFPKTNEVKDDCLYCEEMKEETKRAAVALKNDSYLDSPLDSGISTENTSLDRSPSLDLVPNENLKKECVLRGGGKEATPQPPRHTKDTNNLNDSEKSLILPAEYNCNPSVTVTTIPCQCSIENSPVKNIEINYSESNSMKSNETCDVLTMRCDASARTSGVGGGGGLADLSPSTSRCGGNASPHLKRRANLTPRHRKRSHQRANGAGGFKDTLCIPVPDNLSMCSSETSSFNSECADDEEIALAMQAAEIANRNEVRAKFRSSEDLVHRLFVCIAGVADQLQTNFASDLRNILKSVFLMNANDTNTDEPVAIDAISESIEYCASESDIIHTDEFSIDPNILAQEALFDTNVYFQIEDQPGPQSQSDETAAVRERLEAGPSVTQTEPALGDPAPASKATLGCPEPVVSPPPPPPPPPPAPPQPQLVDVNGANDERPPVWIPDIQAPKCMSCEANFTVVKRRHHCRNCGKVFCARCSANSVPLPKYGHHKAVRVCNKCFMFHLTPFTM